ncbi:hypothetical protein M422DRAFT_247338 [Sphaerobolus stellatus SS14]|nr:hypothetical protein M422DRAFT_247338 [Sphaerobolus stellatus SS14]
MAPKRKPLDKVPAGTGDAADCGSTPHVTGGNDPTLDPGKDPSQGASVASETNTLRPTTRSTHVTDQLAHPANEWGMSEDPTQTPNPHNESGDLLLHKIYSDYSEPSERSASANPDPKELALGDQIQEMLDTINEHMDETPVANLQVRDRVASGEPPALLGVLKCSLPGRILPTQTPVLQTNRQPLSPYTPTKGKRTIQADSRHKESLMTLYHHETAYGQGNRYFIKRYNGHRSSSAQTPTKAMAPQSIFGSATVSSHNPSPSESLKHPASSPLKRKKSKRSKVLISNQEDPFDDMGEAQPIQNEFSSGSTPHTTTAVQPERPTTESSTTEVREEENPVSSSDGKIPSQISTSAGHPPGAAKTVEPHPSPQSPPAAEPHTEATPPPPQGLSSVPPSTPRSDISMGDTPRPPHTPIRAAVPANSEGLMAVPLGGFPPSEQVDFSSLAMALYPIRVKQLNERATDTDCVTYVLNGRFNLEAEQAAAIEEHIRTITGNDNTEVLAGSPPTRRIPGGPAFPHMICGLIPEQKKMLVDRSIWNPAPTWFAITLSNINLEPGRHEGRVAAEVGAFFSTYAQLQDYIRKHHDNLSLPLGETPTTAAYIRELCRTIVAKGIRVQELSCMHTYFNIHMQPPSITRKGYRNWLSLLQSTTYFLDKNVAKPLNPGFICVICKGHDHPKESCPFPDGRQIIDLPPVTLPIKVAMMTVLMTMETPSWRMPAETPNNATDIDIAGIATHLTDLTRSGPRFPGVRGDVCVATAHMSNDNPRDNGSSYPGPHLTGRCSLEGSPGEEAASRDERDLPRSQPPSSPTLPRRPLNAVHTDST